MIRNTDGAARICSGRKQLVTLPKKLHEPPFLLVTIIQRFEYAVQKVIYLGYNCKACSSNLS
jgi:hypothetical protein